MIAALITLPIFILLMAVYSLVKGKQEFDRLERLAHATATRPLTSHHRFADLVEGNRPMGSAL